MVPLQGRGQCDCRREYGGGGQENHHGESGLEDSGGTEGRKRGRGQVEQVQETTK